MTKMMREIGISPLAKSIIQPPLPFGSTAYALMNASKFDALPENLKKLMLDICKGMEKEAWDFYGKSVEAEIEKLKGMGVKMVELVGEEREIYLKSTAKGLYDVYLADTPKNGPVLMDMVKKYLIKVD